MKRTAVLMTCFNRVQSTLECLTCLFEASLPEGVVLDVYLVDDNSPDKTGVKVKEKYPSINVIQGTGKLYWNGGMRLAWDVATKNFDYDFYLWLNDDTLLFKEALITLFSDLCDNSIVVGSCLNKDLTERTYGVRSDQYKFIEKGAGLYINGNVVLIPVDVFKKIGGLSSSFTHAIGDTEYGFRCNRNNILNNTSSTIVGTCDRNPVCDLTNKSLRFKIKNLYSVKGVCIVERCIFQFRYFGFFSALRLFIRSNLSLVISF